jgi:quinol monooxygenase YgiN
MTRLDGMVPGDSRAGPGGTLTPEFPGRPRAASHALYNPGAPRAEPVTGAIERRGAGLSRSPAPGERPGAPAIPGTDIVRPAPRPHGLIAIYTLLEDKVAAFDRIAEEAAEQVRAHEPDTLVYVIHTVPKAPMQRIFYEIYRDRAAYERHEQQPYIKRFVTARRPHVLATNVIELRLKYAKISPLMQDETQAATPVGALPGSGGQAPGPWAPAPGYGGTPTAGYGGTSAPGPGPAQADPLTLDYPRAPRDSPDRGDGRTRKGSRAGSDARVAGDRQGREQLPPPAPPRQYGGI